MRFALLRGSDPEPVQLNGVFLTRAVTVDFLVGVADWVSLIGNKSKPILRVMFTITHCDPAGTRAVPMASDVVTKLEDAGAKPLSKRSAWISAPSYAFAYSMVARWTELDYNGHVNMSHYAAWMDEARYVAANVDGYGSNLRVQASAPPRRVEVDFRGQARAGESVTIFTWWNGDAFCFEIRRKDELLTTGRIWVSVDPLGDDKQSKSVGGWGLAKL